MITQSEENEMSSSDPKKDEVAAESVPTSAPEAEKETQQEPIRIEFPYSELIRLHRSGQSASGGRYCGLAGAEKGERC
jgi:hypothetical protein